ncbi:hypothetical protein ES703_76438 [subsurface metagenome]
MLELVNFEENEPSPDSNKIKPLILQEVLLGYVNM